MLYNSKLYILLSLVFIVFCTRKPNTKASKEQPDDLNSLITTLDTQEKKEQFLAELYYNDQDVRNKDRAHEILKRNKYDMGSYEYQEYSDRRRYIDAINFDKAKKYLEVYGYPKFKPSTYRSISAFSLICMHQPTYQQQLELFPYLYQAYRDSLITADNFSFLLNNMHRHKFGESHPHAISNEENIIQLLEKLDLN
ncbi:hypothetical protein [Aquimarina sp. LLG6339-5]|uniref:hypothetical protein n=1 Tax=Aquimarina sp. LLG6339-5 TaxID=3160830 RepID=UPI00386A437F